MPAINEVLQQGRYRITQRFDKEAGYEAYDNVLEANVFLKEIPVALDKSATAAQAENIKFKFADRAKVLTEIKHESLLQVRDFFSEADCQYLVSETVPDKDLSEYLGKDKNSLADVIKWTVQLLDALNYLHTLTSPIIYGDLKPQNVKLTGSGKVKLLAFGIAGNAAANMNLSAGNQTIDQAALHYSPLEQIWTGLDHASQNVIAASYDEKSEKILNQPADARSDIYALGATLYHLLTGRLPIDALERSIDILDGKPDPLPIASRLNPKVPTEISDVLMKALEIKRENRFDSALIMRQVLRTAVVRLKERETLEAKKKNNILEIPPAAHKNSEPKSRVVDQERLKIEAEQKQQTEQIKQRLRESEARRLEAEQRAAEAEKLLSEKEFKKNNGQKPLAAAAKTSKDFTQVSSPAVVLPQPVIGNFASENPAHEFKSLFAEPRKDNKTWRRMSVAAVILVICGGAFFGMRFLQTSKTAELNQTISEQTTSLEAKAAPTVEAATVPIVEATPETSELIAKPSETSSFREPPINRPSLRNKPAPPAPRIEKQTPPPTKAKPKKEKVVTVDDLINPN
jgi:serine/threonine protein kinase